MQVSEFHHLRESTEQLFSILSKLPQFGREHWVIHYSRTFDSISKLWRLQQKERQTLVEAGVLQRSTIGAIASRVGQVYYHYYTRTCDLYYLQQAGLFYEAIRTRQYFRDSFSSDQESANRTLRYYVRYIVVSLLLGYSRPSILALLSEFSSCVESYLKEYAGKDDTDWSFLVREVSRFVESIYLLDITNNSNSPLSFAPRLPLYWIESTYPYVTPRRYSVADSPRPESLSPPLPTPVASVSFFSDGFGTLTSRSLGLRLRDVLIVGSKVQPKVSELSLDMYRMTTTIERRPEDHNQINQPVNNDLTKVDVPLAKYLLFRPSIGLFLTGLSTSFDELPSNGVLLAYISADNHSIRTQSNLIGDDSISVVDCLKFDCESSSTDSLFPSDLIPFTRKNLCLIIESPCAHSFASLAPRVGNHLGLILSPQKIPTNISIKLQNSLLTSFLYSPALSFVALAFGDVSIDHQKLKSVDIVISNSLGEIARLMTSSFELHDTIYQFFDDDYLRILILRAMFCRRALLSVLGNDLGEEFLPLIKPGVPDHVWESNIWTKLFADVLNLLREEEDVLDDLDD
ncbi:hypothetical protein RCL1_005608 [Eukaryota sp. TZLM3-RCL]